MYQDICAKALLTYGPESQTRMLFEEMAELQKELCKEARGIGDVDAIAEEIADVYIMLQQMVMLHKCEVAVVRWMDYKIDRLGKKMKEEAAHGK